MISMKPRFFFFNTSIKGSPQINGTIEHKDLTPDPCWNRFLSSVNCGWLYYNVFAVLLMQVLIFWYELQDLRNVACMFYACEIKYQWALIFFFLQPYV